MRKGPRGVGRKKVAIGKWAQARKAAQAGSRRTTVDIPKGVKRFGFVTALEKSEDRLRRIERLLDIVLTELTNVQLSLGEFETTLDGFGKKLGGGEG